MRGCTGAGSTQARTLTCMSPPPLALRPCLDLYGFRVLSNSDRSCLLICSLQDQAGARFGLALARLLVLIEIEVDLSRLDRCQFGLGGLEAVFFT